MDTEHNFALVRKPSSAVEKAALGAQRILSSIVGDTLALAKSARPLRVISVGYAADWLFLLEGIEISIRNQYKNAKIKSFMDGDLAWQELVREEPDLLIATLGREKGLNGFDMVARLAERKVKYPILAYDALMDKHSEEHVLRLAGLNLKVSCLYCPFTFEQFNEVFSKLLEEHPQFQNNES